MEEIMKNKRKWLGILVIVLIFGMTVVGCITMTPASEIGTIWVSNNSSVSYWIAGPHLRNHVMDYRLNRSPLEAGKTTSFIAYEDGTYFIYYRPFLPFTGDTATEPSDNNFRSWSSKTVTISKGEVVRIQIP